MVTATTSSAAEHSGGARAFRVTRKRVDRHRWRPCWLPHCVAISCRESLFPLSALKVEQGNTGPPTHCTKVSKITSVARQLGSGNSELISRFEWETQHAARCHTRVLRSSPKNLAKNTSFRDLGDCSAHRFYGTRGSQIGRRSTSSHEVDSGIESASESPPHGTCSFTIEHRSAATGECGGSTPL